MCCLIPDTPIEDSRGRIKTFTQHPYTFQTDMMNAPCSGGLSTCCWCLGQFFPMTMGCTQYALRRKVLKYDMTRYVCCQGYYGQCCCFKPGSCGEKECPDLCLFIEGCFCNGCAVSASRIFVMETYQLRSDPCDYRLIHCNNMLQALACICDILAIFVAELRQVAQIIDRIADIFYHTITGCMTAQVSHEMDYQNSLPLNASQNNPIVIAVPVGHDSPYGKEKGGSEWN